MTMWSSLPLYKWYFLPFTPFLKFVNLTWIKYTFLSCCVFYRTKYVGVLRVLSFNNYFKCYIFIIPFVWFLADQSSVMSTPCHHSLGFSSFGMTCTLNELIILESTYTYPTATAIKLNATARGWLNISFLNRTLEMCTSYCFLRPLCPPFNRLSVHRMGKWMVTVMKGSVREI